ncbi:MAG: hypothetical protein JW716_04195 [Candidatus Aenigmarchaeota archaeon]|nr:hypothetical protein [Candidatus Aenigmarchaeota archaeon]
MRDGSGSSIYGRIGWLGTLDVVARSMPFYRFPALPYGFHVYKKCFQIDRTTDELLHSLSDIDDHSLFFRPLRPKFRKARRILKNKYRIY